jgi:hypothetical protein
VLKLRKEDPLPTNPNPQKTSLNRDPHEGPTTKLRPMGSKDELKTENGEGVPHGELRIVKESHTHGESDPVEDYSTRDELKMVKESHASRRLRR